MVELVDKRLDLLFHASIRICVDAVESCGGEQVSLRSEVNGQVNARGGVSFSPNLIRD